MQLDKSKIEVIRWLIFDRDQRSEAIHQGNALMRQFLGKHVLLTTPSLTTPPSATRKLSAAEALFRKLPSDSVEVVKRVWASKVGPIQSLTIHHYILCRLETVLYQQI